MHRRFSSLVKSPKASTSTVHYDDDTESKASTVVKDEPLPPASSKVKRVDYYYSRWGKQWKYKNMNSKVTIESDGGAGGGVTLPFMGDRNNDPWKDCSFVLVRTLPQVESRQPTFKIVIKSEYILKACQDVIQTWPGISWNAEPLQLEPELFLTWYDSFIEYRDALAAQKARTEQETNVLTSVNTLVSFLSTDFRSTLAQIQRLTSHGEITFDLLYAILVPRTLMVARCAITGLERLFVLQSFMRTAIDGVPVYSLALESVDLIYRPMTQSVGPGRVFISINIKNFKGTVRIDSLDAYPLKFHPAEEQLRNTVKERGKQWTGLNGVHHREYSGIAAFKVLGQIVRQQVDGRIMVDRATFHRMNPNYSFPIPVPPKVETPGQFPAQPMMTPPQHWGAQDMYEEYDGGPQPAMMPPPVPVPVQAYGQPHMQGMAQPIMMPPMFGNNASELVNSQADATATTIELSEEDLLLTPTVVYGFSLADKSWLEFDVTKVQPVQWQSDAFKNLVLPGDRKTLLRSLVEAHHEGAGVDDFIKGKGVGLVVNLFGPPGVGKTFSAEATSEHVQRPLYVIGGGDLGTRAADLDATLERVFNVATAWRAIVLIDEADVFLERRSLHDLERNAMVAVFLRHVEYYRGILFLTTNRVQAFDEAFLSRIHVALHFSELSEASRGQVWRAFISRMNGSTSVSVSEEQFALLAKRPINGRQIKNAVRTAHSLALGRQEAVGFPHLLETLDAMDEFTTQFRGEKTHDG